MKAWRFSDSFASCRAGAGVGLLVAAAAAVEILAGNRRTINLPSGAVLCALWLAGGGVVGLATGWLGGRGGRTFRLPALEVAMALAALAAGRAFLPAWGPLLGIALPVLRWARRRIAADAPRVDWALTAALAVGAGWLLLRDPPPLPPYSSADRPALSAVPLPGSASVTITIHPETPFPDVPASHVKLRALASALPGRRAALQTGRAPSRTRAGTTTPRKLPFGGGISWTPDRPAARVLVRALPAAREGEAPFTLRLTLERMAEESGISVLRNWPAAGDPPLFLRILELDSAPDAARARELRAGSAWIDVSLGKDSERLAVTGAPFRLEPVQGPASLMDVAPTALHLLGLPIPRSCDGRVLVELLDDSGRRPLRYAGF